MVDMINRLSLKDFLDQLKQLRIKLGMTQYNIETHPLYVEFYELLERAEHSYQDMMRGHSLSPNGAYIRISDLVDLEKNSASTADYSASVAARAIESVPPLKVINPVFLETLISNYCRFLKDKNEIVASAS